jgi:serine/threonine-protein kinase
MLPSRVGPYEIKSEIGGNERGRVFEAFDPRSNRAVALKMIQSQSLFTLTGKRKFDDQLNTLQALTHPNLMPIIDFGDEDRRPYIVMPLMAGNLTRKMEGGPLPVGKVLELARALAAGLDHAAANGVYHTDLKPNNVLFDIHDHLFIGDLGIAQVIESLSAANRPEVNPHYMSPEQVRKRKPTGQAQQYSLAALLFHLLSGEVLFAGATDLVASFKHTSERPRSINQLRPELSEAFGEVLGKALKKVPADRYSSSVEFVANLVRAYGGAITPEEVRADRASASPAVRTPQMVLPQAGPPTIQLPGITNAARARMLVVLSISLSICICAASGVLFSLMESP